MGQLQTPHGNIETPVEATVSLLIRGLNDGPLANDDFYELGEADTLTGNVLADDRDPDGDSLAVTTVQDAPLAETNDITLGSGATVVVQSDGSFVYTRPVQSEGLSGDTFTYHVADPSGAWAEGIVTIQY